MKNWLSRLLALYLLNLLLISTIAAAEQSATRTIQVTLTDSTEINIQVAESPGDPLVVWFIDHDEERPQFEGMLKAIQASGIEVWRVDLLSDYFLPYNNENVRTLSGEGVAAVIDAAHEHSTKTILLVAYDRMSLPLLRGVREWAARFRGQSRLAGSVLYYPNPFGPAPVAGEAPQLDPIVAASNYPLFVVQPAIGSQRWRIDEVMEAFWAAGAPAYLMLLNDVRDWFFMHPPGTNAHETQATQAVPRELVRYAALLQAATKPDATIPIDENRTIGLGSIHGLVRLNGKSRAPALNLSALEQGYLFPGYSGRVTLINFWATWCRPCVEELPSLNRLNRRYTNQPFELVSVDFRESETELRQFMKKIPVDFPILLDLDGKSSLQWDVFSFPSSFLVDHTGAVRYSINQAIDWDTPEVYAIIEGLLAEAGHTSGASSLRQSSR